MSENHYPHSVGRRTLGLVRGHAAIVGADCVYFVDTGRVGSSTRIELAGATDLAVVGEQVWVAAGEPASVHRFDVKGRRVGQPIPLVGAAKEGMFRPTAVGSAGAVWTGPPPVMIAGDGKVTPIPGEADCVIPVSSGRWVACRRDRVVLRDPSAERWSVPAVASQRVIDGAALLDGRTATLVAGHGKTPSQLLVIGLHDGSIQHRVTLTGIELVRFAAARGYALLRSGARTLVLFDLRFGRVLQEHTEDRDILDVAIDSAGQAFIVRYGDDADDIAFCTVRELLAASRSKPAVAAPSHGDIAEGAAEGAEGDVNGAGADGELAGPAEAVTTEPLIAQDAESAATGTVAAGTAATGMAATSTAGAGSAATRSAGAEFYRGHAKLVASAALAPRVERPVIPPARATALLDGYRPLIAGFVGRAIALAWDHGRIAFPNESHLPFRDEVAGILGRMAGRAPDELVAAERQILEASEAARAAEAAIAPGVSPLTALAEEHGLSPVARLLLMLIAGPSLWGELARLYGILGNDEQRPLVDEQLLIQILEGQVGRHEVARELDRDAPLLRNGLVKTGAGRMRPFIELTCEPIVLRILRANGPEHELHDIRIVRATCSFEDLLIPAATKDAIVDAIAAATAPGRIVVRGRNGAGRHTLLAAIATSVNRTLGIIDATAIVRDLRARIGQLRSALYRAHLLGLLPCVDGLETLASEDHAARDLIAGVLEEHPGPLAVRLPWDGQPILRPGHVAIDLPALSLAQRGVCWDVLLRKHGVYVRTPDEIAERFGVGPGVIDRVCRRVAQATPAENKNGTASNGNHDASDGNASNGNDAAIGDAAAGPRDRSVEIEAAIRQHLESRLGATSTRVARLATWARVVLPPDIQESVLELIARIKHRRTVYDAWGFDQVLTTARGVTALFQGGPGTGKTIVASAIANELGMDLYRVDLSRIMSKWIGETEQNLAKLFDAAEDGHAIILFDEADSLFAKRTEVRTSVDRYANLEVNYLLQRLDTFEGIAILTTNFGTAIDSAFKRRLSFRLTLPFPDEEAREALWRSHLPPQAPRLGSFDLADLARRYRLSGGYIRNAAVRAAFLAAEEQSPLTQDHLERAIRAEFREIGKIAESGMLE
jgi:hypothetical protein